MLHVCGGLLARLHSLPLDEAARVSLHRPDYILNDLRAYLRETPDTPDQQRMAEEIWQVIANFPSFDGLPEGLVHTDPYFVNLLETPRGGLTLIDWEDAGIAYPLMDVGYVGYLATYLPHDRANLGLADDRRPVTWRPDWAQAFLDGYQEVRPLTRSERELFPWALRLNFLEYIWEWTERRIIPENFQRMKILEGFQPLWA
jgi:thiamine kinase-like enzyme